MKPRDCHCVALFVSRLTDSVLVKVSTEGKRVGCRKARKGSIKFAKSQVFRGCRADDRNGGSTFHHQSRPRRPRKPRRASCGRCRIWLGRETSPGRAGSVCAL